MRVAVIGGNLQGTEAAYLAGKAGWEILVIDRKLEVPAKGLCHQYMQLNVADEKDFGRALKGADLIIPALENDAALAVIWQCARNEGIALAFDTKAYSVSSSKLKSNRLFVQADIPLPLPWPDCGFPVLAKPSLGSGSKNVGVIHNSDDLQKYLHAPAGKWVLQEYIQGPSFSIEVVGCPGNYQCLQVTDLDMGDDYDCKRVLAPSHLPGTLILEFEQLAESLAEELHLKGMMDVEVVLAEQQLKVLEIDARLPSQTPTVVFWSTGANMVQMLGELFVNGSWLPPERLSSDKHVIYEHIKVSSNLLEVAGEHIMSGAGSLHVQPHFFGADEAITNYVQGGTNWVATLIVCEDNRDAAWEKRNGVIADIRQYLKIDEYRDLSPKMSRKEFI